MSMLSGTVLGPGGEGPRRRHPVATGILLLLMMAVIFGATFGAVRLLRGGSSTPDASPTSASPQPCATTTVRPGLVLPKPGTVTTNVYNATDRAGLARRTADQLTARGFVVSRVANDPLGKTVPGVAEIRFGPAGKTNAQLMGFYIVGATKVADKRTDDSIDVVTGVKFVAVADQKTVTAALAKPVVTTSGAGCPSPSAAKPVPSGGTAKPSPSPSAS
jgi:LytR cell envelope-related transcriptional attenuator